MKAFCLLITILTTACWAHAQDTSGMNLVPEAGNPRQQEIAFKQRVDDAILRDRQVIDSLIMAASAKFNCSGVRLIRDAGMPPTNRMWTMNNRIWHHVYRLNICRQTRIYRWVGSDAQFYHFQEVTEEASDGRIPIGKSYDLLGIRNSNLPPQQNCGGLSSFNGNCEPIMQPPPPATVYPGEDANLVWQSHTSLGDRWRAALRMEGRNRDTLDRDRAIIRGILIRAAAQYNCPNVRLVLPNGVNSIDPDWHSQGYKDWEAINAPYTRIYVVDVCGTKKRLEFIGIIGNEYHFRDLTPVTDPNGIP